MSENIVSTHPKASVAAITTGIESLALLIPNELIKKIFLILSPGIALVGIFIFKNLHKQIESQRGLKAYKNTIIELQNDLNNPWLTEVEKKEILAEIKDCKEKIKKIKLESIKIIIN